MISVPQGNYVSWHLLVYSTLHSLLATPIEVHCILLLVLFVLQGMSGSGPDDLNEEPDINANPPIDLPTSQGFEEVSSIFKTYLATLWRRRAKSSKVHKKIDLQAEKFKFRGNQKQFVFNAELEELAGKIKDANAQRDHKKVAQLTDQTKSLLHKRQKLIKLADSSEEG